MKVGNLELKRWLVIMILAVAVIPPAFVFFSRYILGVPLFKGEELLQDVIYSTIFSLTVTILLFLGNLYFIGKLDQFLPFQKSITKRIIIEFFVVTIYTSLVMLVLSYGHHMFVEPKAYFQQYLYENLVIANVITIIVTSVLEGRKFFLNWKESLLRAEELKQEHLKNELTYLKNQVNPHFLFNSLNSLYFLIKKDEDKAQKLLMQLSEMLSYQLYETDDNLVPLKKEVDYLKNYIALEKARQGNEVKVKFRIEGDLDDKDVPPMLLLPFVENAFKHSRSSSETVRLIDIKLKTIDNSLYFEIRNPFAGHESTKKHSGLGLKNVKSRLKLLYGSDYQLNIEESENQFIVKLKIPLE